MQKVLITALLWGALMGSAGAQAPQQPSYYYCDQLHAYYPTVQRCPQPWRAVPIQNDPKEAQKPEAEVVAPVAPKEPVATAPLPSTTPIPAAPINSAQMPPRQTVPVSTTTSEEGSPVGALAMIGTAIGGIWYFRRRIKNRNIARLREIIADAVAKHLSTLRRLRSQKVRKNEWGHEIDTGWQKEIEYFIQNVFSPGISASDQFLFKRYPGWRSILIFEIERQIADAPEPAFQFFPGMDPIAYEHFCAERLRLAGWDARVTKQSGDQGVDVIAEAAGRRLVVQCKLYSQPVGNSAVQEIAAGRAYEEAHFAAVVTNSGFTTSARELASKLGIALVTHDQIEEYGRNLLLN